MQKKPAKRRPSKSDRPKRARPAKVENPVDNPVSADTPMREGNNGGQLRTGGTNKGGPGRPPNALRELCRESGFGGMDWVRKVADGRIKVAKDLRIKCIDLSLKYGIGTRVEVETPVTPVVFGVLVSPEVAAERAAQENAA